MHQNTTPTQLERRGIMAAGSEALNTVKATEPTQWLAPSPELSENARAALKSLFSSLRPFTPKSPFNELLVEEDFDAEQIWQQIDIQSQPLISSLRREVKRYEKNPEEIKTLKVVVEGEEKVLESQNEEKDSEDFDEESDDEEEGDDVEENEDDDEDEEEEEEENVEEEEEGDGEKNEIEDGFFNVKALGKYLKTTEAEEYENESEEGADEDGDEKDEEDEAQELMNLDESEDDGDGKGARYEDFFGKKELSTHKKEISIHDKDLSTHEREQLKLKAEIEQREKTMLDPKTWTMQGEVTAAKRPPNSALEVDLDFEHNVRPAPPITEEVTLAIEDMIRKRIEQDLFDDVQRAPALPTKAPRERKEMDENKSKKGLAEDYEREYVQKMNPDSGPLSSKDEQKHEAEMLFRKLCLKLDALSHFHFTPKPVIEDMSIQDNVPALAMEEIAPVAVSDAAMLAPEEVFSGKGDIKEEAELTQAERKRRRANKKRKFKVTAKKMAKKPRDSNKDIIEAM
uniref:U3 small nucleolar ribonucleoprotein protein MPP10 isoform X2 n=1 Tax=Fragaria vesca subsp. vesca TaxID=101020 RepID=UPI0005CB2721|nr:PREDICTED: U3 small nucleolar ribonucleoprotein protein MPP10 isoform X2 [Fragaria vesca subsp. vesca]